MNTHQTKIIDLARECMGTPFAHQGRIPGTALDCAGLLVQVMEGLGLAYDDQHGYPRRPYRGLLEKALREQPCMNEVPKSELAAGDVVLFRISTSPQHIGIYTGGNVIHAYSTTGRVVEQSFAPWRGNLTHVYRIVK